MLPSLFCENKWASTCLNYRSASRKGSPNCKIMKNSEKIRKTGMLHVYIEFVIVFMADVSVFQSFVINDTYVR
jgi:hypothetical protein